jgi:hypothetical protein
MDPQQYINGRIIVRWFFVNALSVMSVGAIDVNAEEKPTQAGSAEHVRFYSSVDSITYAENISIDAWMNDLHTQDTSPGEYAFTRNFSEFGFAIGQMSLAGFVRKDYYLHFSQDTFDLVYQDKNKIPFDTNRNYAINLDVAHVQIKGISVGYDFAPIKNVKYRIEANFFDAEEVLFGNIHGFLRSNAGKIQGDLVLDYNYTEDVVLDRPLTPPAKGRGRSMDAEIWWQVSQQWTTHVLVEDLYSTINWSETPFTQANITTVRNYTDSSGVARRMPTISGRESFRQTTQRIPRHIQADVTYQINEPFSVELAQERFDDVVFNRVMGYYHILPSVAVGLGYDATPRAPRLEVHSRYINLMASVDTTDSKKAKFVNFSAGVQIAF